MSSKKSYMNKNNLLNEGFFDTLKKFIKDKSKIKKLRSDKKFMSHLNNLNKSWASIEKILRDDGIDTKYQKFTPKDFKR